MITLSTHTIAQVSVTRIDIAVRDMPLEEVLMHLQQQYHLNFSYGLDNVTTKTPVTISGQSVTLFYVIQQIAKQTNLDFSIIGNIIVFKRKPVAMKPAIPALTVATIDSILPLPDTTQWLGVSRRPAAISELPLEVRLNRPVLGALLPVLVGSEKKRRKIHTAHWAVMAALHTDFNQYQFKPRDPDFQQYDHHTNYGVAVHVQYYFGRGVCISTGAAMIYKDFTLHYNFKVTDPDDPFPIQDQTVVNYSYLEIPIAVAVPVVRWKQTAISLKSALAYTTLIHAGETTSYLNKAPHPSTTFTGESFSPLYSASAGVMMNYWFTKHIGAYAESSIGLFNQPVNKVAMQSPSHMLRLTTGITCRFTKR